MNEWMPEQAEAPEPDLRRPGAAPAQPSAAFCSAS
jgi:hypothetical protein